MLIIATVPFSVSAKASTLSTCFCESYTGAFFILLPVMYPYMKAGKKKKRKEKRDTGGLKCALPELQKPSFTSEERCFPTYIIP